MYLRTTALLAVGLLALCTTHVDAQGKKGPKGEGAAAGWLSSLYDGKAQASKSGKPIMVVLRCQP